MVELLVSLLIFGMLSAAGVALLSFSVRAQQVAEVRLGDVAALRRASALIAADLGQAAPRVHRDEAGLPRPAFLGGPGGGGIAIGFVRRGWENVGAEPRASVQRVEYRVAGDRLERRAWPRIDGAGPLAPTVLIDGVRRLRLRYRDREGEWRDRWDPTDPAELPLAVEMVLETGATGTTRQLFLAGRGR